MFHDDDDDGGIVLKPKPRRPFELSSPPPSAPSTPPATNQAFPPYLQAPNSNMDGSTSPSRTQSFLNLTSSALYGIYQSTGYTNPTDREEVNTPWGTGAQTPAESPVSRQSPVDWPRARIPETELHNGHGAPKMTRRSTAAQQRVHHMPRKGFKGYYVPLFGRVVALFAIGVLYALLITQLHERREIAPVKVDLNRSSWTYLVWWGMAGVLLGEALPWADTFWAPEGDDTVPETDRDRKNDRGLDGWIDVVRSIGAFVGIAFAIRKLPWESTLQLSLTLALANPALWYLIDRSPPGFVLSSFFAVGGTAIMLGIHPALVPSPTPAEVLRNHVARNGGLKGSLTVLPDEDLLLGIFSQDSVGVATWIASVFFVSAVCFGNIGRWLAPREP